MKYLTYATDVLIAIVVVVALIILMHLIVDSQSYDCFDSAAGRKLADGSRSLFGSFVEATNCEYDDYLGQYTCDRGVYKYCYEGGEIIRAPSDKEYVPVWNVPIYTQGDEAL